MIQDFVNNHIPDFFWAMGAFVVFVLILLKVGLKPVAKALAEREAKITREIKESEDAYAKAKALKEQLDAQLRNAENKISEMMAEARRDAEAHKTSLVEQGRGEIEGIRQRSLRDIDAARSAALLDLRSEVAEIATQVAEKIVKQNLDARGNDQLVAAAIDAFEAQRK